MQESNRDCMNAYYPFALSTPSSKSGQRDKHCYHSNSLASFAPFPSYTLQATRLLVRERNIALRCYRCSDQYCRFLPNSFAISSVSQICHTYNIVRLLVLSNRLTSINCCLNVFISGSWNLHTSVIGVVPLLCIMIIRRTAYSANTAKY